MDREYAEMAFELAEDIIRSGKYHIVVLDEVLQALELEILRPEPLLSLLKTRPKFVEVVLTGNKMPAAIEEIANNIITLNITRTPGKEFGPRFGIEF